jgi:DNA-binding MarR family transcriptional regulator
MPPHDRFSNTIRERWIAFIQKSHPDIDPRAARLLDDFRVVAHQVHQLSETNLDSSGLSYAQYRVLMNLRFCEWEGKCDGLNPSEISATQGTSRNTISSLIRSLEENGYIERQLDHEDRRRFNIHLSDAGREKAREHEHNHFKLIADLFSVLTPEEIDTLSTLLQKLGNRINSLKE